MSKLKNFKKKVSKNEIKESSKNELNKYSKHNKNFILIGVILILLVSILLIIIFSFNNDSVCKIDGKPIIRMYSTNTCPHCIWVGPTFEEVVKEYMDENKIIAHHWKWVFNNKNELIGVDDVLTPEFEGTMSKEEEDIFNKFSPNSSVPVFVFGCKESRIGNTFESQNNLDLEKKEFIRMIEDLLK